MQEAYQNDLKAYRDNINVLETARLDGEAVGEARGETNKALEIARSMKKDGIDPAVIAKHTGLSLTEIKRLK